MDNAEKFSQSLQKLAELIKNKLTAGDSGLIEENKKLKQELETTKKEYQVLVTTSDDVINELNNSIQVIDNYFKMQDASNKNT